MKLKSCWIMLWKDQKTNIDFGSVEIGLVVSVKGWMIMVWWDYLSAVNECVCSTYEHGIIQ